MSFNTRNEIVTIDDVKNTKQMVLKILQAQKQSIKSAIVRTKQEIEDLRQGKIAELEYALMKAEAQFKLIQEKEVLVKNSVDTEDVK